MANGKKIAETLETRRIIRDWLAATEPESEYQRNLGRKSQGTCSWVIETKEYKDWFTALAGEETNLWIKGKPGTFKFLRCCLVFGANHVCYCMFRCREVGSVSVNPRCSLPAAKPSGPLLLFPERRPNQIKLSRDACKYHRPAADS